MKKRTLRETIELIDEYKKDLSKEEYNELIRSKYIGVEHRYARELEKLLLEFREYYKSILGKKIARDRIVNKAIEIINIDEIINEIESKEVKLRNELRANVDISIINCKKIFNIQDRIGISRNNLINFLTLKYFGENSFEDILKEIDSENSKSEK